MNSFCFDLPISCVPALVVLQIALGPETQSTTVRAQERPFVPVDPHMRFQILPLTEQLSAACDTAPKRLVSVVYMHMGSHACFARKALLAAGKLASEGFASLLWILQITVDLRALVQFVFLDAVAFFLFLLVMVGFVLMQCSLRLGIIFSLYKMRRRVLLVSSDFGCALSIGHLDFLLISHRN